MAASSLPLRMTFSESSRYATLFTSSSWACTSRTTRLAGTSNSAIEYGSLVPAMTRSADRLILMDQMPCTRRSPRGSSSMLKSSGSWMSVTFCTLCTSACALRLTSCTTGLMVA